MSDMPTPRRQQKLGPDKKPGGDDRWYSKNGGYMDATELEYTYWQDGDWFLGYLHKYPDHWSQGKDLAELEEMLADIYMIFEDKLPEPKPPADCKTGVLRLGAVPA